MTIALSCPQCGKSLRVADSLAGKSGKCPGCQATIAVPKAAAPTAPSPAKASAPRVLTAHDLQYNGRIALPPVSGARQLGGLAVLGVLLLMPAFYAAVMMALLALVAWLPYSALGRGLPAAAVWAVQIVAGLLLLCLVKRLLEPQRRSAAMYPVDLTEAPLLGVLLNQTSQQLGAKAPKRVQVACDTRVAFRNRGGGELTLGLPLVACLSVQELAGAIGRELALVRPASSSGVTTLIRGINAWLWNSVYGHSRLDQWLSLVAQRQHFHFSKLLLPLAATKIVPQAVLFVPMFIANTIGAGVIRLAERDADVVASRLIGAKAFAGLLEREELIDFTWEGVLAELEFLYREQQLPDRLPDHLELRMQDMTPELMEVLGETVNKAQERPFDSQASRPERVAALAGEPASGAFQCPLPAKLLLAKYDALARQMTRDLFAARFGASYLRAAVQAIPATVKKAELLQ